MEWWYFFSHQRCKIMVSSLQLRPLGVVTFVWKHEHLNPFSIACLVHRHWSIEFFTLLNLCTGSRWRPLTKDQYCHYDTTFRFPHTDHMEIITGTDLSYCSGISDHYSRLLWDFTEIHLMPLAIQPEKHKVDALHKKPLRVYWKYLML